MDLKEAKRHVEEAVIYRPNPTTHYRGVLTQFADRGRVYVRLENSKSPMPVEPKYLELAQ
jgi:hypothetical protein